MTTASNPSARAPFSQPTRSPSRSDWRHTASCPSSAARSETPAMTSSSVSEPYCSGSRVPSAPRFGPNRNSALIDPPSHGLQHLDHDLVGDVGGHRRPADVFQQDESKRAAALLVHPHRLQDVGGGW